MDLTMATLTKENIHACHDMIKQLDYVCAAFFLTERNPHCNYYYSGWEFSDHNWIRIKYSVKNGDGSYETESMIVPISKIIEFGGNIMDEHKTYNKWITIEDGCELPDDWEGVIVAARTRTKIEKAVYIDGKFLLLHGSHVICPKKYMRIDVSDIDREKDGFTYEK